MIAHPREHDVGELAPLIYVDRSRQGRTHMVAYLADYLLGFVVLMVEQRVLNARVKDDVKWANRLRARMLAAAANSTT